ncbi:MAG TPA: TonB-dependent receptor [Ferruginibacter sp.]|nr:TonB-dependent receptor [Ferruginibacter sp.]HMP19366.1 TonB-dependent receptor [Ferruginibacter sp.]
MKKISSTVACIFMLASAYAQSSIDTGSNNILLNEVVLTGSKTAVSKNYIPFNITVVGRQQIENSSESALLPVLADNVPGLFVTERGVTGFGVSTGAAGSISMRGLSGSPNTRVLMLINGVPQFMGIFGHPLPDAYVASDAEKVEVLHGSGSVLYGTNAMGGVINIITRNQPSDGYHVNARVVYGSFNTQKYMAHAGWRKKGFSIMGSVNHDRTDGHRPSSDFKITNGYLKMGYVFSSRFNISAETNIAKYLSTDPGPTNGSVGNSIDIVRGSTYLTLANTYSKSSGMVQLFYNYGNHKITDGFRSTDGNYGFSVSQSFRHIKNNTSTIGFDYKHYGGKAQNIFAMNGQGIVFGDHTITEYAPYLLTQQTISSKLTLSAGIRREQHNVFGSVLVPSGGVAYRAAAATTIKANVSKGFRSPTILDLYLFPPANPLLQPEKMMNYEASVSQVLAKGKLKTELTVFNVRGNNMIQTVFQNGGPKNVNTGSFNNTGMEWSVHYFYNTHFTAMLAYGYTNMKQPVVAAPKHLLNTALNFNKNKWMLHTALQWVNGLYTQVTPAAVQSNYLLLNARAGYRISKLADIFVKGENLTNRKYEINYAYPMPGATVLGGINFHLQGKAD